jgi:hypothetical protein
MKPTPLPPLNHVAASHFFSPPWYTCAMDKDTKDILETVNFIKDHMLLKTEFDEAVEKLDHRLIAVESKIAGIHNRIDDEALKRTNLESRVRSAVPNLPPAPDHV